MNDKGNGGSKGPFQDSPIFGRKRPKIPGLPKLPDFKLPLRGRKSTALVVAILVITAMAYNLLLGTDGQDPQ